MNYFIIFLMNLIISVYAESKLGPEIVLPKGKIQGFIKQSYGERAYMSFEGIPYAKPPLNQLRFKMPEPAENWTETLIANKYYICTQFQPLSMIGNSVLGQEDCLYINVYVPGEMINTETTLDVVAHIHGGAFIMGSPKMLAGPNYVMDKDVIYVNFNYRLGIFGFLSTEDNVVQGNNGLKDQALALQWVKDNIKYFGGNADSITLTGLSAGGCSVHFHYFSPKSNDLFTRGMSMSGTAFNFWALVENPLSKTQRLVKMLNCDMENISDSIDCLRTKSDKEIAESMGHFMVFVNAIPFTPFGPIIEKGDMDTAFLYEHPYKLLIEKRFNDKPWITSNVKDEGIFPVGLFVMLKKLKELDTKWNEILPYALDFKETVEESDMDKVSSEIREYYMKNNSINLANIDSLIKMFTDRCFMVDAQKAVYLQAIHSESPVYYYYFSYILEQIALFGDVKGSAHADDGRLLFDIVSTPKHLSENDSAMKDIFTDILFSYAQNGTPSYCTEKEWLPVTNDRLNLLSIESSNKIEMKTFEDMVSTNFWNSLPIMENNKLFD